MDSVEFIQWCLEHLNYWTVMFLMMIESSFIPFPSEIVVPPAAYMVAEKGDMNLFLVIVFATVGANLGALINYAIAYFVGRPVVYKFANSKLGHLCLIDEAKVVKAEEFFAKHGAVSTFVGRLIPAVRQLISIPAGLAKMKMATFILYTTLGAGIWNLILALAGYYMQSVMSLDDMLSTVESYSHEFKIICLIVGVLVVAYLVVKTFSKNKKSGSQDFNQE
jgi:membrane protein DedA with SNARE-associated domain